MAPDTFTIIARVVKTHGLKGEVSVAPAATTSLSAFLGKRVWFVPPVNSVRDAVIETVRSTGKGELVRLSGVDHIDKAQLLCGRSLLVADVDLPTGWGEIEEEEDFEGFVVTDATHGLIGDIVETIHTGANDVWVVEGPLGEVLIPVIEQVVLDIDEGERTVLVRLLEGLLPDSGYDS